jgi:hypothetical protein
LAGLVGTFRIGNTTEAFHFSGNSELTKIWLKKWVSTGKSNLMNDKDIPSTPGGIRPDEHNSVIDSNFD